MFAMFPSNNGRIMEVCRIVWSARTNRSESLLHISVRHSVHVEWKWLCFVELYVWTPGGTCCMWNRWIWVGNDYLNIWFSSSTWIFASRYNGIASEILTLEYVARARDVNDVDNVTPRILIFDASTDWNISQTKEQMTKNLWIRGNFFFSLFFPFFRLWTCIR